MAGSPSDPSLPRLFKLVVLTSWIGVFWGLLTSLHGPPPIAMFLSPHYWCLVKMGTAVTIIYCISTYYLVPRRMGMGAIAGLVQVGLLVLPIIYLPTAVSTQLSPVAFEKRSVGGLNGSAAAEMQSDATGPSLPAKGSMGKVSLLNLSMKPSAYEGREVETEGMVYRDDELGNRRFICFRLLIWCCAADARPVGVLVQAKHPITVSAGQWVRVEGVVSKSSIDGRQVITLCNAELQRIDPPNTPYLFD